MHLTRYKRAEFGANNGTMMRMGGLFSSEVCEFREILYQFSVFPIAPALLDTNPLGEGSQNLKTAPSARLLQTFRPTSALGHLFDQPQRR